MATFVEENRTLRSHSFIPGYLDTGLISYENG